MKQILTKFSRKLCIVVLLCICLVALLISAILYHTKATDSSNDEESVMYTTQDDEGNILGPTDYAYDVENDTSSILNTATNAIYTYQGTELQSCVSLDDFNIIGIKIGQENGNIYILGNDSELYRIQSDGILCKLYNASEELKSNLSLGSAPDVATITELKVISNSIYLCQSRPDGSITYVMPTEASELSKSTVHVVEGRLAEDGIFYTTTLKPEGDYFCGHTCEIALKRADGTLITTITLTSEKLIDGATYLYTDADGNYIIKEYNLNETDDSGRELLLTVSKDNKVLSSREIPVTQNTDGSGS